MLEGFDSFQALQQAHIFEEGKSKESCELSEDFCCLKQEFLLLNNKEVKEMMMFERVEGSWNKNVPMAKLNPSPISLQVTEKLQSMLIPHESELILLPSLSKNPYLILAIPLNRTEHCRSISYTSLESWSILINNYFIFDLNLKYRHPPDTLTQITAKEQQNFLLCLLVLYLAWKICKQKRHDDRYSNHSGVIFLRQQSQSSHLSIFPSLLVSTLLKKSSQLFWTIFLLKYLWALSSSLIHDLSSFRSRTLFLSLSCVRKMSSTNFLQYESIILL